MREMIELVDEKDIKKESIITIDDRKWKIYNKKLFPSEIKYKMFIFHDDARPFLPKIDRRFLLTVRCKDINKSVNTTDKKCIRCEEPVFISPYLFKHEDTENVICNQCARITNKPHPIITDKKSRNRMIGSIGMTNWGAYRIYGVSSFFDMYHPKEYDMVQFYFCIENNNDIEIEFIKNEKSPFGMTLRCPICKLEYKLSNEELVDVVHFALKNKLQCSDMLNYMNIKKGRVCKGDKNHVFEFDPKFCSELREMVEIYEDVVSRRAVYLQFFKDADQTIVKMEERFCQISATKLWKELR